MHTLTLLFHIFYCCRLYYLSHGPMKTLVTEESVIRFLFWFSPVLSGILTTLHIIEGYFRFPDNPMIFFYSFCKKTSFPSDMINEIIVFKIYVTIFMIPSLIAEMCSHITILVKQTRIENKATVYMVKNGRRISRQRHHRNVVSAVGHFLSFVLNLFETFLHINALFFFFDMETVTIIRNLNFFFLPSIKFAIYPLVETLFSETLRDSLLPQIVYVPFTSLQRRTQV